MADNSFLLTLFPWAPRPAIVLSLVVAAVAVALIIHALAWAVLGRLVGPRHVLLHLIVTRTRAIGRFACIIIAFGLVLPIAPFDPRIADIVEPSRT